MILENWGNIQYSTSKGLTSCDGLSAEQDGCLGMAILPNVVHANQV